jgi:hypothetical protein
MVYRCIPYIMQFHTQAMTPFIDQTFSIIVKVLTASDDSQICLDQVTTSGLQEFLRFAYFWDPRIIGQAGSFDHFSVYFSSPTTFPFGHC